MTHRYGDERQSERSGRTVFRRVSVGWVDERKPKNSHYKKNNLQKILLPTTFPITTPINKNSNQKRIEAKLLFLLVFLLSGLTQLPVGLVGT